MPTFGVRTMRVLCPLAGFLAVCLAIGCIRNGQWFLAIVSGGLAMINGYLTTVQWLVFTPERRD